MKSLGFLELALGLKPPLHWSLGFLGAFRMRWPNCPSQGGEDSVHEEKGRADVLITFLQDLKKKKLMGFDQLFILKRERIRV